MRPYAPAEREALEELVASLGGSVNRDGGWGASAGLLSTTEATALASLALRSPSSEQSLPDIEPALDWLLSRQLRDGGWPLSDVVPGSCWMTSLAVISLAGMPRSDHMQRAAVRGGLWLLRQRGLGTHWLLKVMYRLNLVPRTESAVELDRDLIGWPWTAESFSWVEPTAYAVIALKLMRPQLPRHTPDDRIDMAEAMLLDRACPGGGWNYGNSRVLGEDLWPYADTTALALIALGNRSTGVTTEGLQALRGMLETNDSPLALALGILAFDMYGRDAGNLRERLIDSIDQKGPPGDVRALSFALIALSARGDLFRFDIDG